MAISRRILLRRFGATTLASVVVPSFDGLSLARSLRAQPDASQSPEPLLLDHNENAYGPSEKVLAVLRDTASLSNRYPRTECDALIAKIAAVHNVKSEQVVLGCGSSELLRLAATAFLRPGKTLVQASPTHPVLGKLARSLGAEVIDVPLNRVHEHDVAAMQAHIRDTTGLVYVCNPNNPTGSLTPRKDIEALIRKLPAKTMLLIDEAYHQFVDPHPNYISFLDQPVDDPRVMVTRTFSKIYGLAGMRVGYAVAAPDVARRLSAGQLHFAVGSVAAKAAAAALDDSPYVRLSAKRNADDRQEFMNRVNGGMLRAIDSHTNFVMMDPLRPPDEVIEHLKKNNIRIGPPIPAMDKYIRVSLGTPAEMDEFWRVWDLMPATGKMAM
jgi:histidinol-phosphate aminotransferase